MPKLTLKLLRHTERRELEKYLRLYQRSFNPDERVSPSVLRSVMVPSAARVNPVHLFAAYRGDCLVGGACTLVLPAFSVVFGSYIFVDPELRGRGLGMQILRQLLRQERRGPQGWNWRLYIEVTVASGRRRLPFFRGPVAACVLSPSRRDGGGESRVFPVSENAAAPVFPTRTALVHSRVVLWTGFDPSPLAAAPEELRGIGCGRR